MVTIGPKMFLLLKSGIFKMSSLYSSSVRAWIYYLFLFYRAVILACFVIIFSLDLFSYLLMCRLIATKICLCGQKLTSIIFSWSLYVDIRKQIELAASIMCCIYISPYSDEVIKMRKSFANKQRKLLFFDCLSVKWVAADAHSSFNHVTMLNFPLAPCGERH